MNLGFIRQKIRFMFTIFKQPFFTYLDLITFTTVAAV